MATFEELMKQVASLQAENSNLRRELQNNSSNLTKLESEAHSMKDVLSHLQHAIQEDDEPPSHYSHMELHSFSAETEDNSLQECSQLDHNSNESEDEILDPNWDKTVPPTSNTTRIQNHTPTIPTNPLPTGEPQNAVVTSDSNLNILQAEEGRKPPVPADSVQPKSRKSSYDESPTDTSEKPPKKRSGEKELYEYFQELDKERKSLTQELENEERQRKWYCDQLEGLQRQADELPAVDQYNSQSEVTRRQLEYERQRLLDLMRKNMGSEEDVRSRHEARMQRVRMIEAEMLRVQQRHKESKTHSCEKPTFSFQDGVFVDSTANSQSESSVQSNFDAERNSSGIFIGGKHITLGTQTPDPPSEQDLATQHHDNKADYNNQNLATLYHGSWPIERGSESDISISALGNQETASVMSFRTNNTASTQHADMATGGGGYQGGGVVVAPLHAGHQAYLGQQVSQPPQPQHLGTKVEMVYGLLSMLGTHDKDDMSRTLLAMSSSQDSCIAMRQSGCLPLLIQLLHGSDSENGLLGKTRGSKAARARASAALHNIVHSHPDDKRGRREARVLRLLEQIRAHWDQLREGSEEHAGERGSPEARVDMDHHPGPAIAALMKLSFDEEHRHAICTLGGLQAIAELLLVDHEVNGNTNEQYNITMRRYACMALTNLTFGDGTNKALLCSMKQCMRALVAQLQSPNEDLRQVAASVLRNLSWRADLASKKILREVGAVPALMVASMDVEKESTLKSVLSALWNLSAHCSENKADICAVSGSLAFLVATLSYKSPTKTLSIIENGGGILRNISSHIAVREEYRQSLRHHGCLQILLKHLRSPSLTIVSNACGTLWNLSARCAEDQKALWEMGAVGMLKNLVNSKHKMISMGSAAALKNLLNAKTTLGLENEKLFNTNKPGLHIRKQRALEAELDPNLAETCDNMESPTDSPTHTSKRHDHRNTKLQLMYSESAGVYPMTYSHQGPLQYHTSRMTASDAAPFVRENHQASLPNRPVSRSGSQDSVGSVHSDISHDRTRLMLYKTSKMLDQRLKGNRSPYRNNSMNRSRSGSQERSHGDHPNRIMKVMNEVAKHSGLDTSGHLLPSDGAQFSLKESHSAENTPALTRRTPNASFHEMPGKAARFKSKPGGGFDYNTHSSQMNGNKHVGVASLSRNMEKLHLSLKEATSDVQNDDKPMNYAVKYSDTQAKPKQNTNSPFTASYNSAFRPNPPQVNNFVGYATNSSSRVTGMAHSKQQLQQHPNYKRIPREDSQAMGKTGSGSNGSHWNGADITPTDEQPTDFSMRFAEQEDDTAREDEPVNYSTRYSENREEQQAKELSAFPAQTSRAGTMHFQEHISTMDDDTVKTFCTEGTPLNFLSTATSLTDLSKIDEQGRDQSEAHADKVKAKKVEDLNASRDETTNYASRDAEAERKSVAESHSTERDTSSTVVDLSKAAADQTKVSAQKSAPCDKTSQPLSQVPSLYSYNDNSSVSASPSEKPTKYCTEGTPLCFSRVSSLSSLHSSDGNESHPHPNKSADLTLQAIDENQSLDTSLNQTLKDGNESLLHAKNKANDSGHTKTVTFDNNYQIQETPLMFSRCSSIGSLSSFDVHSVHSSVMSEYSRRTSGVVSPSELPDSPSDTMPPSPSRRKSPIPVQHPLQVRHIENRIDPVASQRVTPAVQKAPVTSVPQPLRSLAVSQAARVTPPAQPITPPPENTKIYAEENCPEFSCASSLSALTFDDEPTIVKDPGLKRIPLGEEDGMSEKYSDKQSDKTGSKGSPVNDTILELAEEESLQETDNKEKTEYGDAKDDFDDEDDGNSSVSEGEENLLQECIKIGMPPSSKKKIHKSASDNSLKSKGQVPAQKATSGIPRSATTPYHLNISLNNTPDLSSSSLSQSMSMNGPRQALYQQPSQAVTHPSAVRQPRLLQQPRDSMGPRSTRDTKMAVRRTQTMPLSKMDDYQPQGYDCPKNYATEGTPLEFSRATSLSDLTVDDQSDVTKVEKKKEMLQGADDNEADNKSDNSSLFDSGDDEDLLSEAIEAAMPKSKKPAKALPPPASLPRKPITVSRPDVPHHQGQAAKPHQAVFQLPLSKPNVSGYGQKVEPVADGDDIRSYAVEGTPLNFSRAESLSDLSDLNSVSDTKSLGGRDGVSKLRHKSASDHMMMGRPTEPAVLKMKAREDVIEGYGERDTLKSYAVEDTPYTFSRRTSLSALSIPHDDDVDSDTHSQASSNRAEITVIQRQPPVSQSADAVKTYAVEDTPYNFSRRTSLSDISDEEAGERQVEEKKKNREMPNHDPLAAEDGVKTYAVEDTPYNFSRRTSLSALSIPDDSERPLGLMNEGHDSSGDMSGQSGETSQNVTVFISKTENLPPPPDFDDVPRVYNEEGTPLNFSRNESLSFLSCDEFGDDADSSTHAQHGGSGAKKTPVKSAIRKVGIQSPAITRLKTPQKVFRHVPTAHSTPMAKHIGDFVQPEPPADSEIPQSFAVEDTPAIMSRNPSFSSLESGDHEGLANRSGDSTDSDPTLQTKTKEGKDSTKIVQESNLVSGDNHSYNSSLSSLSVESLSFEPSESESALLEECISSAMPKSTKKLKRKESLSKLARPSPSGSSGHNTPRRGQPYTVSKLAKSDEAIQKLEYPEQTTSKQEVATAAVTAQGGESVDEQHVANVNNNNVVTTPKHEQKKSITDAVLKQTDGSDCVAAGETTKALKQADTDATKLAEAFADLENQFAEFGMSDNNKGTGVSGAITSSTSSTKSAYNMESSTEEDSRMSQISTATKDLCVEAKHMVDVIQREKETAPSDQSTDSLEASTGRHQEGNIPDIMKESFPEMTSSLISNITTPDRENLPEMSLPVEINDDAKNTSHTSSIAQSDNSCNITVIAKKVAPDAIPEESGSSKDVLQKNDPLNMTEEEEKALEENANIVLSCMAANQMSTSSVSDDAFIDQECISLVSSGPWDTGSDLSGSATCSVRGQRDNLDSVATQDSESTLCRTPSGREEEPCKQKPRIVKPGERDTSHPEESVPKGIRGGKKVIKGRPPPANVSRNSPTQSWKSPESKVISPKGQVVKKPPAKTTPSKPANDAGKRQAGGSAKPQSKSNGSPRNSNGSGVTHVKQPAGVQKQVSQKESSSPSPRGLKKPTAGRTPPQVSSKPNPGVPTRVSPKQPGIPKPAQPQVKPAAPSRPPQISAEELEELGVYEKPPQLTKQGTFVKDDSSYSLASSDATTVRYRTPPDSNRNSCEIRSSRSSVDTTGSNRNSVEIKYSRSANDVPSGRSRPTSKSSEGKSSPTKSEKSDHGCFTVEGYTGAWEGSSFTVCDYTGAWEEVRRRRRSGESGSGSCTDTPPTHRRSLIIDPEMGIIEDSYNAEVFEQNSEEPPSHESAPQRQIQKPSQIAKPNAIASRLPQSRLPGPRRASAGSPKASSNSSLARSSSSGSASSLKGSLKSNLAKPATPPRASSLGQRPGERSMTPPSRSGTPPSRSGNQARSVSPQLKSTAPTRSIPAPRRSPLAQPQPARKNSTDSSVSSRSSTPQSRTVPTSKAATRPAAEPAKATSLPAKKQTTSKIAGFWRKDKSKEAKSKAKSSASEVGLPSMQTSLVRSGTYEKLDATAEASPDYAPPVIDEARKAKEKRAAKVKLWRRTYTVKSSDNEQEDDSSVSGSVGDVRGASQSGDNAASSGDLVSGLEEATSVVKKSRSRRSGLFRRNKDINKDMDEPKKDKKDALKRRFGLWRKDSSEKGEKAEDLSPSEAHNTADLYTEGQVVKRKHGLWRKRQSDIENDMNSPNDVTPQMENTNGFDITPTKTQVVQPFNYIPAHKLDTVQSKPEVVKTPEQVSDDVAMPPPPAPPRMTKTEMLMARRRKVHQNSSGGSGGSEVSLDGDEAKKQSFLVTTV